MTLLDFPPWLLALFLAPFGLVVGSFGNVLIHRLPQEAPEDRNVATKPSHCPACKAPVRWYQNIPVLSWLALRGRCASCGWRIPFRYPLVEALTGLLFAASVYLFPFGTLIWVKGLICGYALIVLFFTDFTQFFLPDALQFPLMVLGVAFALPQLFWPEVTTKVVGPQGIFLVVDSFRNGLQPAPGWSLLGQAVDWKTSLIGLGLGYGAPWLFNEAYKRFRKIDGMGMGDFKMLAWLGAFWGWGPMLGILFAGSILGIFLGIPLALASMAAEQTRVKRTLRAFGYATAGAYCARVQRGLMTRMLPFGCALALATPLIVFFGPALWMGYMALLS